MSRKLENTLFQMKFTAKALVRQSKKCESSKKKWQKKLADAIKASDPERAKIYAENVIREQNQALNYLRLSSRLEAVAGRVETALRTHMLSKQMSTIVSGMDKVLGSMDTAALARVMESFESQFEDLDVKSAFMEEAMTSTTAGTTPVDAVQAAIAEAAEANRLELGDEFADLMPPGSVAAKSSAERTGPMPIASGGDTHGDDDAGDDGPGAASGGGGSSSAGGGGGGGGGIASDLEARLAALRT